LLLPVRRQLLHLLLRRWLPEPAGTKASEAGRLLLSMTPHQATPDTESIWRTLSDRVRHFVRSRVASNDDADDILQNVFLRIHEKLETLRESERLESWVFQIARNAIVDYRRRKTPSSLDPEAVTAPADDAASDSLVVGIASCLGMMIEQLPGELKRAVAMFERDGVSQKEIATLEAISLSGAKSRVQRGRKLLKEMLEQCCRLQLDRHGNVLDWDAPAACDSTTQSCDCTRRDR
jgi:RNA polymerase sigma-70 factor (ECF subfamily)